MDKRDLHEVFRDRLQELCDRFEGNRTRFAETIGLDRSALSQLLAAGSTRLPRAETLQRLAATHSVSLDWILGLSQSDRIAGEILPTLEIEEASGEASGEAGDTQLIRWHRDAIGYKIRYVPQTVPDLLRTTSVIAYEFEGEQRPGIATKIRDADHRLAYTRDPETDLEACMPYQTLEDLAAGNGIWSALPAGDRQEQITYMARLVRELYPTFRLFLFDGRRTHSAPYTVFGPQRVAVYIGAMYLVVNSTDHIRSFTRHFDDLIRAARITPTEAPDFIAGLSG